MKEEQEKQETTTESQKKLNKPLIFGGIILGVFLAGFIGGLAILDNHYRSRILPDIYVGDINLGGLTTEEALVTLETWQDNWWANQLQYRIKDEQGHELTQIAFYPLVVIDEGQGNSYEFIWYDLQKMVDSAFSVGQNKVLFQRLTRELGIAHDIVLSAQVEIDEDQLREVLALELEPYETKGADAQYEWKKANQDPQVISEQHGNIFDYDKAIEDTKSSLSAMKLDPVMIARSAAIPSIKAEDAQNLKEEIKQVQEKFPLVTVYQDPVVGIERKWTLTWEDAYMSVQPINDAGTIKLGLVDIEPYWERIESLVNSDSSDARFEIDEESKKVKQFQPSKPGYTFNREKTLIAMNEYLQQEDSMDISVIVDSVAPDISTADVNDLGITEVLGVGYSSFAGSPRNRVHNISVGVEKLNGVLIAPDEEFSLLAALRPFTISGGYLPELVIKGDKITPEVGGGLCQIGSTTFRAAMKAGLDIVERRNHSLVVNYYNDPRNGNPGTDATIYDSSPDFKFKNDTGNYILLTTEMNASNGDLWFTFWGTNDGRSADYTEPVVHRWIPTGPTKYIETTDLAPGQQKCQGAHPGASTSFTYEVEYSDGTTHEEVFSSSYRPLPTICLVGIDPNAPQEGEPGEAGEVEGTNELEPEVTQAETQESSQDTVG